LKTMKRTYIDASVLIAAFRGDRVTSRRAVEVLEAPDRKLVVSDFLRLELLPKPTFYKRTEEVEFMKAVLDHAAEDAPCNPNVTKKAIELASSYDVAPVDALHLGAAASAKVDELVTMEKPTKPLCRVKEIRVTSLYPASEEGR